MFQMISHQGLADGAKRLLHGRKLNENVGAVAVFFDHALKAANLAFDAAEAMKIRELDIGIDACRFLGASLRITSARRNSGLFHLIYPLGVS